MASRGLLDVEVRYLDACGEEVTGPLAGVDPEAVVAGRPVRRFPSYKNQGNYPGWLWSVTMGRLVGYESLLERDRLWLADFDPTVLGIASQPLWMSGRDGSVLRRHVPDFLLKTESGFVVVDVKPEKMLADPEVAAALSWAGRVSAARGWRFEIWSGADPVLLRNVRFLAAGRRPELIDPVLLGKVADALRPGMSVAEAESACEVEPELARSAVLALLWHGLWVTDMTKPLSPSSILTPGGAGSVTSSSASFEVRVGNRVWLDGQGWNICELTGESVRLRGADAIRTVSLSMLADVVIDPPSSGEETTVPATAWGIPAVLLAGLTRAQKDQLSTKLAALRRVLEPDPDDGRPIVQRYEDEAATLGVSRRTLQRLGSKLLEVGPSGLVDGRLMAEDRRSIDPRWDEACREVLDAAANASNPTRQWVISRANQSYLTAVPDGKVPSPAVAYRRVAELDKGRYTFGAAKQRRSVAKRPQGVLGRLRADRPGQYVLMDSYRLDVFAMEPVTLRWVNTELTVAMDLFDRCITGLPQPTASHRLLRPVRRTGSGGGERRPARGQPESSR